MPPYPVSVRIQLSSGVRNRASTAFRPILAIPHAMLVGPIYWSSRTGGVGLLGAAAYVLAIISWFTLLITGQHLRGIRDFTLYYLRWRVRALAYMSLCVDTYPPFGDAAYPADLEVTEPAQRDLVSIGLRLLFALPHLIVLFFLTTGWLVVTVIAWAAILLTGAYPASLLPFATGVMRWLVRVEAYVLLLVDEYPPFAIE